MSRKRHTNRAPQPVTGNNPATAPAPRAPPAPFISWLSLTVAIAALASGLCAFALSRHNYNRQAGNVRASIDIVNGYPKSEDVPANLLKESAITGETFPT